MIYVTSHPKLETESEICIIILLTASPNTIIQKKENANKTSIALNYEL